ncbi:flavin adenine dinucleotide transporter [Saccharomyces eubayanus]|uniref:flavin adenine dinucleotide transporter n=1 Tax=Saccharomyces eubayanus TaxID=1080349 RepID=UPI0006C11FBC|nr:FLC1-like protein [Saccharomyces eubayanus]KOG96102.1 FLC1-like protein [Saccharomyces eubayanus]
MRGFSLLHSGANTAPRMQALLTVWYLISACLVAPVAAKKRTLTATSLVTCMENSQLSANSFEVSFSPDDRALHYDLDMTTQIDSYISAYVDVYAYGFKIIKEDFDVCSMNWKQFCPVHPGNIQIDSIEYIAQNYVDMIPGIAYQVPDIDAYLRLNIYNNVSENLACIQVFFSNGKTVSQIGVKWVTAVIAGIGLLTSAILSTFGSSTAASHISANTMSLFLYFQSVAVVAMQHVDSVPPIAAAWSENLAWSMGLIRITFMQKIFRWYVDATGGSASLYLTATTMSVLTQRGLDYLKATSIYKRAENVLYGNANTLIFRGIKRMGYRMKIENTAIVCTGFTFFVLCGYFLAGFIMACKYGIELCIRCGWVRSDRFYQFRQNWKSVLKGSLLRYLYIGFTQLTILSFWEFTERDSAGVIVIACLFIILSCGLMAWAAYRTIFFASKSVEMYNNPAALLYGDEYVLNKYGFFYTMFNANHYWWNAVLMTYVFIKALFIGFAQASGKTQALAIFIIDLAYFVAIIRNKPYLDRPTNIVNIFISTVTLVNSFLFMFFSDLFNQNYAVSAVMGWVFFIMNAAFSLLLLLMILTFTAIIVFSKNPDSRFKPAKDDRASFQRHTIPHEGGLNKSVANELMALGNVAKDHTENWEYKLKSQEGKSDENLFGVDYDDEKTGSNSDNAENSSKETTRPTFSEKVLRSLSIKRNKSKLGSNRRKTPVKVAQKEPSTGSTNSSPINKSYPGISHMRQESEANNGLINAYEDEEFNLMEPNVPEDATSFNQMDIMPIRDMSLNSMPNTQDVTKKANILDSNYL